MAENKLAFLALLLVIEKKYSGMVVAKNKITWGLTAFILSIVVLSSMLLNRHYSEVDSSESVLYDGLYTGARHSLDYINYARAYPQKQIPPTGFAQAFEELAIQKRKSTLNPTWETLGPVNVGGRTLALAINPENPDIIFAGSASGGLWKSSTGGVGLDAWEYVRTGFPVLGVGAIDFDPNNPSVMFIGTGESYGTDVNMPGIGPERTTRGSYGIGILKSEDGGVTWRKSLDWSVQQQQAVQKIQINPKRSNTIWAATTDGAYRSQNGGETWVNVHSVPMATDVVINPADTNVVFLTHGGLGSFGHGIYRSTDGGLNFEKLSMVSAGGPFRFFGKAVLAISESNPDIVMVSIGNSNGIINGTEEDYVTWTLRSEDGGNNWDLVYTGSEYYATFQGWYSHAIAIHPQNPDVVWAAGQPFTVYRSNFKGANFGTILPRSDVPVEAGENDDVYPFLPGWADHHDIIFHPSNPDTIYFVNDGGIFRTIDGGTTFENCNYGYQTVQFYNGVSNSNTNPNLILGGLQDNNSVIYEGSLNWRRAYAGDGSWTALNQSNNDIAYLSAQFGQAMVSFDLFTGDNSSDFRMRPDFGTFPGHESNFITPFVLSPADNQTIYMGGEEIYKTTDNGQSWEVTNGGNKLDGNAMSVMAASEQNANKVYAASSPKATRANVYKTENGGDTWIRITGNLPDRFPTDLAVDPNNDSIVYITFAGFGSSHVFKSINSGENWTDITHNLPDIPTWSVKVDPQNVNHVFVGNELGVYQSLDGGESWVNINGNLPDAVFAMDLFISRSNRKLRVATHGNGVYEVELSQLNSIENNTAIIPDFRLFQNYPNPFNPGTTIQYQLETAAFVQLNVYDIQGRLVSTLVNEPKQMGIYTARFDGSNLASGTYVYRLQIGDQQLTKTMLLVK